MSKYSVELNELLTNEKTKELIDQALSSYPLYTPIHEQLYGFIPTREELNKKILNHYRFYEIGSETIGRFLFNLETAMNEIMPFYNQMYKSIDVMNGLEDIFGNLDIVESFEQESSGNNTSNTTGEVSGNDSTNTTSKVTSENSTTSNMSTDGRTASSKTPQSQLSAKTINNITAASEMGWNENNSNSTATANDESNSTSQTTSNNTQSSETNSTGSSSGSVKHTLQRKGNQGVNTYAHDMLEFRQLFDNIEQRIINDRELATCFMLLW